MIPIPEILGEHGLLKHWTPRVVERALEAELPVYLGYAPQARQGGESDRRAPADWQRPKVVRWPAVACPGTHRQHVREPSLAVAHPRAAFLAFDSPPTVV